MKKSEYSRSTAELKFSELRPKFISYFQKYLEENKLEILESDIRFCFETTNEKKKFFGGVETNYTVICLTNNFLFWGIIHDKKESGIAAAKWEDISEIWDWKDTAMGQFMQESGVELFGFIYLWSKRGKWFIGLGNDEAGLKCKKLLFSSINKKDDSIFEN
jgi:hypothetical protein